MTADTDHVSHRAFERSDSGISNTNFTNDPGVFTFNGDTARITNQGGGFYADKAGSSTLNLDGFSTATFASVGVESEFNAASFYDIPNGFALGVYSESIGSYDLSAPYGPVSGSFAGTSGIAEATSLGALYISGEQGDVTFTANAVTPEPSSIMLLGTGLLCGLVVLRRRLVEAQSSLLSHHATAR